MFKGPFKASMFLHFIAQKLSVFPSRTENNQFIDHKHTEIIKQLNEISIKTQQRTSIVCDVLFFQEVNTFFFLSTSLLKNKVPCKCCTCDDYKFHFATRGFGTIDSLTIFLDEFITCLLGHAIFLQLSYKLSRSNRMRCYQRRNVGPGELKRKKNYSSEIENFLNL